MVCSRRVLVSNLPQMDAESLNDKLGFHFSKRSNGGGEVESCQVTGDTAVITFTEEGREWIPAESRRSWPRPLTPPLCPSVVDGLVLREFHEVKVQNSMHQVRVTPLVNGEIGGFEVRGSAPPPGSVGADGRRFPPPRRRRRFALGRCC